MHCNISVKRFLCIAQEDGLGITAAVSPKIQALRICNLAFILFIHENDRRHAYEGAVILDQRLGPHQSRYGYGSLRRSLF